MAGIQLYELPAQRHARKLFQQQAALTPAAQAELADQLFIAGAVAGTALHQAEQVAVRLRIRGGRLGHR